MQLLPANRESISKAVKALSDGLLVAFPTETVYGLGANALDTAALERLYAAKGRPTNHPVIVHISSADKMSQWASVVPPAARLLAEKLWPGPLTIILPKADHVPEQLTGGQASVGLRVPSHPVALSLLQAFEGGVAAPSANKFGKLSPTSAEDVVQGFDVNEIAVILDGGPCEVGIESTIVDFSTEIPRILRPGMILPEQIEAIVKQAGAHLYHPGFTEPAKTIASKVSTPTTGPTTEKADPAKVQQTRAPGMLASHYAPSTPLTIIDTAKLQASLEELLKQGKRLCVLSWHKRTRTDLPWITAPSEPETYARQLYRSLRSLDRENADLIVVESVPATEAWSGIADRLQRASVPANDPQE